MADPLFVFVTATHDNNELNGCLGVIDKVSNHMDIIHGSAYEIIYNRFYDHEALKELTGLCDNLSVSTVLSC